MQTPSPLVKRLLGSKPLAAMGVIIMIIGGLLFLNSLGSGGGYFPAVLVICGAALLVVAILKSILKA
jgi:hypothetical protein